MKQKTAMQMAIEVIESQAKDSEHPDNIRGTLIIVAMIMTEKFLPTERKQIEEAYLTGHSAGQVSSNQTPSEYYESTYETP